MRVAIMLSSLAVKFEDTNGTTNTNHTRMLYIKVWSGSYGQQSGWLHNVTNTNITVLSYVDSLIPMKKSPFQIGNCLPFTGQQQTCVISKDSQYQWGRVMTNTERSQRKPKFCSFSKHRIAQTKWQDIFEKKIERELKNTANSTGKVRTI